MEIEFFTKEEKAEIIGKLDEVLSLLRESKKWSIEQELFSNADFIKIMKISSRTAQNWRDKGIIEFVKIGDKVYYQRAAIDRMLEKHRMKAFGDMR